jgi:thymidine kinase
MNNLIFYYGTMDSGKSTLALQTNYNKTLASKNGLLFTKNDRAGIGTIYSRIGISSKATEIDDEFDFKKCFINIQSQGVEIDFIVCDEVQFYTSKQIEDLATIVDRFKVNVYCFGLMTDFRTLLFPASKRLVELADRIEKIQVEALCWCGKPALHNARLINKKMVMSGDLILVGDANDNSSVISYEVLCRYHHKKKLTNPEKNNV